MRTTHMLILVLTAIVGGGNFVAAKLVVTEIPPMFATAVRFTIAGVLLLPFLKIVPGRMKAIILTSLNTALVNFALVYQGFARADDVSAIAIVSQAVVPLSTIMAVVFLGEKIGWRRVAAISIAFSGIVLLGFDPRALQYVDALLFILASTFVFSFGLIQMRKLGNVPSMTFLAWQAVLAAPGQMLLSLMFESGQLSATMAASSTALGALVYTAVMATFIVHTGFYYVIQRNPINRVMPFTLLAPIFGVLFAVLFLGEMLSPRMIIGGLLTFVGVAIITFRNRSDIEEIGVSTGDQPYEPATPGERQK